MEKKLVLIILTPVQSNQKQSDDTIRSKSNAGDAYAKGWETTFGPKTPSSVN